MKLYHYTCDHGAEGITRSGFIVPARQVWLGGVPLVWMTDTPASRQALGLSSTMLKCDRMAHRFMVLEPVDAVTWQSVRDNYPRPRVQTLEAAAGSRPARWWVSTAPQPIGGGL